MAMLFGRMVALAFTNGPLPTTFPSGDFTYRGDVTYTDTLEELTNSRVIGAGEGGRIPGEHKWDMSIKVAVDTLDPFIPALFDAYLARAAFTLTSALTIFGGTQSFGGACYIFSMPQQRNVNQVVEITFEVRSTDIVEL